MDYVDRPYLVRTPSQRYANRWQFVSSRPVTPPGPTQVLPVSPLSTLVAHAQPQQPQGQQSQPASPALRPGAIAPAPGQVPPPSPQAPFGSPPLLSSARPLQAISPGRLEAEQGPSKRLGPYKNDLIAVKPIVYGPPPHPFRPATTASYQIIDTQVPSPENPLADTCPYYTYSQELYTQQPPQQPQPYIADPLEQTQKPYLLYPAQPQPPQQICSVFTVFGVLPNAKALLLAVHAAAVSERGGHAAGEGRHHDTGHGDGRVLPDAPHYQHRQRSAGRKEHGNQAQKASGNAHRKVRERRPAGAAAGMV